MAEQGQQRRSGGRGGAPRNEQRAQAPARQPIDYAARAQDVMVKLAQHRPELEAFLPSSITFEKFQSTLAMALRHNPGILECTTSSIIQACMKAAYDDLALDGREAALVPSINKYKDGNEWKSRKEARYNPMVAGLRKQIVRGGKVDDLVSVLVYEGEPYKVIRGTSPELIHEEILDKRGPGKKIIAVYAMAWLTNGRVTFETMSKADVEAVRAMAATQYVWDRNEGEMYRKTVIRRIRKALPGCNDIRDAEAISMFPQFAGASEDPTAQLPPPRPRRDDYARPASLEAPGVTIGDDFANFERRTDEVFVEEGEGAEEGKPAPAKKATPAKSDSQKPTDQTTDNNQQNIEGASAGDGGRVMSPETSSSESGGSANAETGAGAGPTTKGDGEADASPSPASTAPKMPKTSDDWDIWADELRTGVQEFTAADQLNAEWQRQAPLIEKAPEHLRKAVNDAFTEQLAELSVPAGAQPGLDLDNGGGK